jgi:hypothetical protein
VTTLVTVLVTVTGDAAREQADVTMLGGYLLKTDGSTTSLLRTSLDCDGSVIVGRAIAKRPLIVVSWMDVGSRSRFATTNVVVTVGETTVVVVNSVFTSVAVVVASGVEVLIMVVVTTGVV